MTKPEGRGSHDWANAHTLAEWLDINGLTVEDLIRETGYSRSNLYKIIEGRQKPNRGEKCNRLCLVIGLTRLELINMLGSKKDGDKKNQTGPDLDRSENANAGIEPENCQ